jgi:hypothetical protein
MQLVGLVHTTLDRRPLLFPLYPNYMFSSNFHFPRDVQEIQWQ